MRFMGLVGRDLSGANGYLMFARQAQDGHVLFENLDSPEPLPRIFFNLEWWLFGTFARWTDLSLIATFHIGRVLTVLAFALATYYLAAQCLQRVFWRRVALVWIMLGAGLGWIPWTLSLLYAWFNPEHAAALPNQQVSGVLFEGYRFALPFDVAGATIPAYLVNKPHFIRAGVCVAMTYALLIRGLGTGGWGWFIGSGLFAFLHAAIRPFGIPEMGLMYLLVPIVIGLRDRRNVRLALQCAVVLVFLAPPALYYAYLARTNALGSPGPNFPPPSVLSTMGWYGLPLILAVPCLIRLRRFRCLDPSALVLILWLILAAVIGYSYPLLRAGMEGALYAFAMATVFLVLQVAARLPSRRARVLAVVALVLSIPSSTIAYGYMFHRPATQTMPHYLSRDTLAGLAWLEQHGQPGDVVLSRFSTGQFIPRMTGLKAYLGHWMLTPGFWDKNSAFDAFVRGPSIVEEQIGFLRENHIDYLFWGPEERQDATVDPATLPYLHEVFRQHEVAIYRLTRPNP